MKKRVIGLLLVLAMLLGCTSMTAFAADEEQNPDLSMDEILQDVPEEYRPYMQATVDFLNEILAIAEDYANVAEEDYTDEMIADICSRMGASLRALNDAAADLPEEVRQIDGFSDYLALCDELIEKLDGYAEDPSTYDDAEFNEWVENFSLEMAEISEKMEAAMAGGGEEDGDVGSKDEGSKEQGDSSRTESKTEGTSQESDNPKTGDAGVASIAVLMAVASGALLLTRKKTVKE